LVQAWTLKHTCTLIAGCPCLLHTNFSRSERHGALLPFLQPFFLYHSHTIIYPSSLTCLGAHLSSYWHWVPAPTFNSYIQYLAEPAKTLSPHKVLDHRRLTSRWIRLQLVVVVSCYFAEDQGLDLCRSRVLKIMVAMITDL
jgi:hypothetical protein